MNEPTPPVDRDTLAGRYYDEYKAKVAEALAEYDRKMRELEKFNNGS